jgi:uncharacterized DUF497 family protein
LNDPVGTKKTPGRKIRRAFDTAGAHFPNLTENIAQIGKTCKFEFELFFSSVRQPLDLPQRGAATGDTPYRLTDLSCKCIYKRQKHGVSVAAIEGLFSGPVAILPDPGHSGREIRLKAIGQTVEGRMVFLVFTERWQGRRLLIRPISARYMHAKEVRAYEKALAQID